MQARTQKQNPWQRGLPLLLLALFLALPMPACSNNNTNNNNNNTNNNNNNTKPVTRTIEGLKITVESYALDSAEVGKDFLNDKTLRVATIAGVGTLVGCKTGLYQLVNRKFNPLEQNQPVVGLLPWKKDFIVIARPRYIQVWDGSIHTQTIEKQLDGTNITAIAVQKGNDLWIGTEKQLWHLKDDKVTGYSAINGVKQIFSSTATTQVVVEDKDGKFFAISPVATEQGTQYGIRDFSKGEILQLSDGKNLQLASLMPAVGEQFWALSNGTLYQWIKKESEAAWWHYKLRAKDSDPAHKIESVTLDPSTGNLWVYAEKAIFLLDADKARQAERPKELGEAVSMHAGLDNSLWLNDGKTLHHITSTSVGTVTYSSHIVPFMQRNCYRCHDKVGPGRPLNSYELVKENNKAIITQVENGDMPSDKAPLIGGDVSLFKKWEAEGFLQAPPKEEDTP